MVRENPNYILNRLRFGVRKEKIIIGIVSLIFFLFVYFNIYASVNELSDKLSFLFVSIFVFIFGIVLIPIFTSAISLEKDDNKFYNSFFIPYLFSDILFFLLLLDSSAFSFFKNIHFNISSIETLLVGSIALILLIVSYYYIRKDRALKKISPSKSFNIFFMLLSSLLFLIIMYGLMGDGAEIRTIFILKTIGFVIISLFFLIIFLINSRWEFSRAVFLNEENKELNHGDIVYFRGKSILLKEIKNETSFFLYKYTEKLFFHVIKSGNKELNLYHDSSKKNNIMYPNIMPGDEVDFLGKYICIKIDNQEQINFVDPFKINILSDKLKSEDCLSLKEDRKYLGGIIKNKFKLFIERFKEVYLTGGW